MMEIPSNTCLDHEHDWCAIPLHEDAEICANCGEIRQPQPDDSSELLGLEDESLAGLRSSDCKAEVSVCL